MLTLPSRCKQPVTSLLRSDVKILFVLAPLLWITQAHADFDKRRLWLNAGFYSMHFDTDKGLRNTNAGLGFEYRLDETWSTTAGRFINSDNRHSSYLGAYYQPWTVSDMKLGVVGGIFNGYPKAFNGNWFPAIIPVLSWEGHQRFGLNVALVPPLKDRLYGAVSFQLKFRIAP